MDAVNNLKGFFLHRSLIRRLFPGMVPSAVPVIFVLEIVSSGISMLECSSLYIILSIELTFFFSDFIAVC